MTKAKDIRDINGALLINKPQGFFSYDVIRALKNIYKPAKTKIGHCGTLDPNASGLIIIVIGKATKLSKYFIELPKKYIAEGEFGKVSDSLDVDGNITIKSYQNKILPNIEILTNLIRKKFTGKILQQVPYYSAAKVNGKKLYKYALKGEQVNLPVKERTIYSISLEDYNFPHFILNVKCSSGTYVRQIISDIGTELQLGAITTDIVRNEIGDFTIHDSVSINEIRSIEDINKHLISMYDLRKVVNINIPHRHAL